MHLERMDETKKRAMSRNAIMNTNTNTDKTLRAEPLGHGITESLADLIV